MGFVTDSVLILYKAFFTHWILNALSSFLSPFLSGLSSHWLSQSVLCPESLAVGLARLPSNNPRHLLQTTKVIWSHFLQRPIASFSNCAFFYFMALSVQCSSCAVTCRPGEGVHPVQSFPSRSFLVDSFPCCSFSLSDTHTVFLTRDLVVQNQTYSKADKNSLFTVPY